MKRFFIDILTRDIEINAAILDLVDNSVDSAHAMRPNGDFDGLRVDIEAVPERFAISDNCGGISLDAATEYVFRMGRPEDAPGLDSSIGQFGVGMKRALFKLGDAFVVDSSTGASHFTVELDVRNWEDIPDDWNMDLAVHGPGERGYPPNGTTIFVEPLTPDVSAVFGDMVRMNQLRDELRSKHRMAIERGLVLTLNGAELPKTPTVLSVAARSAADLHPLVERFSLTDDEGRTIDVEIYAGVYSRTDADEDAEPEDVATGSAEAGWYVFGNDRLLLAADKTWLTGWGGAGNLPLFHNQYARFRGFVYMTAADSVALPWNTTKTGVENSDPVWLKVRGEMIKAGKVVISVLNDLKLERRALNTAAEELTPDAVPITAVLDSAKPVSVAELKTVDARPLSIVSANDRLSEKARGKRITYMVNDDEFDQAAELLGVTKAVDVGRGTFGYFMAHESDLD
ncbi:ATP-binding protein [Agromyces luteolus]|uniref:ATP-binding protein n=1 Tax=Agromyces luteolus TaxID=88373 RepID=UPI001411FC5D|nr:ATP-binding protein [Agromyces luteolus]